MSNHGAFFNERAEVLSRSFNLNVVESEEDENTEVVETERKFVYH